MRDDQLFALCLAVCAIACDTGNPDRGVVDLDQSRDPSTTVMDGGETPSTPRPGDGGGDDAGPARLPSIPSEGIGGGGKPRHMDASVPAYDAAVMARPDAGRGPYGCETNNDCAITNVGNCCGSYPRCANVNAVFAPPDCSNGRVDTCGFPAIDSCLCRENICRSLQAGAEL